MPDVIDRSGLLTFRGEGDGVRRLADDIKNEPGVEHVAYFGSALHVSGKDRAAIQSALDKHKTPDVSWSEVRTSLEDAFIALSAEAGEDKRVHA